MLASRRPPRPGESIAPIVDTWRRRKAPADGERSPVPSGDPQETDALAPSPTPGGLDARGGGMTAREKVEAAAELAGGLLRRCGKGRQAYQRPTAWRSIRRLERTSILRIQCRKGAAGEPQDEFSM